MLLNSFYLICNCKDTKLNKEIKQKKYYNFLSELLYIWVGLKTEDGGQRVVAHDVAGQYHVASEAGKLNVGAAVAAQVNSSSGIGALHEFGAVEAGAVVPVVEVVKLDALLRKLMGAECCRVGRMCVAALQAHGFSVNGTRGEEECVDWFGLHAVYSVVTLSGQYVDHMPLAVEVDHDTHVSVLPCTVDFKNRLAFGAGSAAKYQVAIAQQMQGQVVAHLPAIVGMVHTTCRHHYKSDGCDKQCPIYAGFAHWFKGWCCSVYCGAWAVVSLALLR